MAMLNNQMVIVVLYLYHYLLYLHNWLDNLVNSYREELELRWEMTGN
jgi:hypothetical protein